MDKIVLIGILFFMAWALWRILKFWFGDAPKPSPRPEPPVVNYYHTTNNIIYIDKRDSLN